MPRQPEANDGRDSKTRTPSKKATSRPAVKRCARSIFGRRRAGPLSRSKLGCWLSIVGSNAHRHPAIRRRLPDLIMVTPECCPCEGCASQELTAAPVVLARAGAGRASSHTSMRWCPRRCSATQVRRGACGGVRAPGCHRNSCPWWQAS
jgi:hypothetical protein